MTFEEEIRNDFLTEAAGLLEQVEEAFIALDSGRATPEKIDQIFRLAHSFKGGAKAVGFNELSEFAHKFEDLLALIKNGKLDLTTSLCTVLFEANDTLKFSVESLKNNHNEKIDYSKNVSSIESAIRGDFSEKIEETSHFSAPTELDSQQDQSNLKEKFEVKSKNSTKVETQKVQKQEEFVRIALNKLDDLINLVGELVVNQTVLTNHRVRGTTESSEAHQIMSYMDKLVNEIRDISLSFRMLPLKQLLQRMQRTARDVATGEGKKIDFVTRGEHVELDRTVIDKIIDPLTHLVRNAVDHGVESSEERALNNKNEKASVILEAEQREDSVVLTLQDDGKGINKEKVLQKAYEKKLVKPDQVLTDDEIYQLIFLPGFSTKDQITEVSGRGVGLNVVKEVVDELKGSIEIKTELNFGTKFIIRLPLSLSIISGMVLDIKNERFVVPLAQLVETIDFSKYHVEKSSEKGLMVNLRGEVIPVYSLPELLKLGSKEEKNQLTKGIVAHTAGTKIAFTIDAIVGQQQIVIKKLGNEMQSLPGILAGAILADGQLGIILNLNDFVEEGKSYGSRAA